MKRAISLRFKPFRKKLGGLLGSKQFIEIEHKFIVHPGTDFDLKTFITQARRLKPLRETTVEVLDRYYRVDRMPHHIIRHRLDVEIQQLTLKSMGGDTETRMEVNIQLDQAAGDQDSQVSKFLSVFDADYVGSIRKNIQVFYFQGCEVVYYHALSEKGSVHCVEFEAQDFENQNHALDIIKNYSRELGFEKRQRSHHSLYEMFFI